MDSGAISTTPANNVGDGNIAKYDPLIKFKEKRKSKAEPKSLRSILNPSMKKEEK